MGSSKLAPRVPYRDFKDVFIEAGTPVRIIFMALAVPAEASNAAVWDEMSERLNTQLGALIDWCYVAAPELYRQPREGLEESQIFDGITFSVGANTNYDSR